MDAAFNPSLAGEGIKANKIDRIWLHFQITLSSYNALIYFD